MTSHRGRLQRNHTWICRTLHPQNYCGNCSRIWLCNGQSSHAKISWIVTQESSMLFLTPHVLFRTHSLMGDTPCMWNASSVSWHGTFSQWDLSIRQIPRNMSRMCHVYVGCDTIYTNECSPEGNRCRKSKVCDAIPKNTPFNLKGPWTLEAITFTVIDKTFMCGVKIVGSYTI